MCWLQQAAQLWSYPTFLLVPLMVIACVECFAGYRAWRFLLGVNGAVLGFIAGAIFWVWWGLPILIVIGALVGAAAGAVLFFNFVRLGSFIFGFGSVSSLMILFGHGVNAPPHLTILLAAVAGLVGALAAAALCRTFMIAIAAVAGAQQFATAWRVYHLPYDAAPAANEFAASESFTFIALAAIGLLLQFMTCPPSSSSSPPTRTRTASPASTN